MIFFCRFSENCFKHMRHNIPPQGEGLARVLNSYVPSPLVITIIALQISIIFHAYCMWLWVTMQSRGEDNQEQCLVETSWRHHVNPWSCHCHPDIHCNDHVMNSNIYFDCQSKSIKCSMLIDPWICTLGLWAHKTESEAQSVYIWDILNFIWGKGKYFNG